MCRTTHIHIHIYIYSERFMLYIYTYVYVWTYVYIYTYLNMSMSFCITLHVCISVCVQNAGAELLPAGTCQRLTRAEAAPPKSPHSSRGHKKVLTLFTYMHAHTCVCSSGLGVCLNMKPSHRLASLWAGTGDLLRPVKLQSYVRRSRRSSSHSCRSPCIGRCPCTHDIAGHGRGQLLGFSIQLLH